MPRSSRGFGSARTPRDHSGISGSGIWFYKDSRIGRTSSITRRIKKIKNMQKNNR